MQTDSRTLLTMSAAAAQLGISRQSLDARLRARGIKPHRTVHGGRVSCRVDQAQIRAAMEEISPGSAHAAPDQLRGQLHAQLQEPDARLRRPESRPADTDADTETGLHGAARAQIAQERAELVRLRQALADAQAQTMQAQALLMAAEKLEKATAARCDKLEAKLDAEGERLAGMRAELAAAKATADLLRTTSQAMFAAETRQLRIDARRSWWPFGR